MNTDLQLKFFVKNPIVKTFFQNFRPSPEPANHFFYYPPLGNQPPLCFLKLVCGFNQQMDFFPSMYFNRSPKLFL